MAEATLGTQGRCWAESTRSWLRILENRSRQPACLRPVTSCNHHPESGNNTLADTSSLFHWTFIPHPDSTRLCDPIISHLPNHGIYKDSMGLFNFLLRLAAALQNFGSAILLPSQHPWYKPPPDIKSHKPGTVISSREIDTNLQGILPRGPTPNVHTAWQYMYRSTDSLGNPVADVATLLVPKNADPKKLLVFQSIYDSANADCGPSYA